MSWTSKIKTGLQITGITLVLFLIVDFIFGKQLLYFTDPIRWIANHERKYRIADPVLHHALAPNYRGTGIWGGVYQICTNEYGFKDSCNEPVKGKEFDLAFIGDSFTEGIGLPYEKTFVGQIAKNNTSLKIVNLGVGSYSPSIYLAKIRKLLSEGFYFKELVVYVDISDIQDEADGYLYANGIIYSMHPENDQVTIVDKVKKYADYAFPFTYSILRKCRAKISGEMPNSVSYLDKNFSRGSWTYNFNSEGYGELGVAGGVAKSVNAMSELYELLKANNINMSVGVYPWPSQILYDDVYSKQVQIWEEFCRERCANFYNSFPVFFKMKDKYGSYESIKINFIDGDFHHNENGASLIANDFIAQMGSRFSATQNKK